MGVQSRFPAPAADRQVLVVGGTVGGLTTAAFLRQGNLSPVVVPARTNTRPTDRDLVLWSSAVSLLAELGVGDDLLASTTAVRRWLLRHPTDGETEALTSAHDGHWPFLTVARSRLRRLLRTLLPAGTLRFSKTPSRLEPTASGLVVTFEDGVRESFDVVVGADGPRSWVRQRRFDVGPPVPWGATNWSLHADARLGRPETVTEQWAPDGTLTCGPLGEPDRIRLVTTAADVDEAVSQLSTSFDLGVLSSSGVSPSELTVVGEHTEYGARSTRWAAGRVALLGSAARPIPPTLSVGPSLAVEEAYVLADELTRRESVTAALHRYAWRRRQRHRTLHGFVSTEGPSPGDCGDPVACSDLHDVRELRATLLRSVFARRAPAVSADVSRHL